MKVLHSTIFLETKGAHDFINITDEARNFVRENKIKNGILNIQELHTSAALMLNECDEPLLVEDIKKHLEKWAPQEATYNHDNFDVRTVNMNPDESINGHAHCKAIVLPSTITLNIIDGELQLGTYQKIFFIEFDCARPRKVQMMLLGEHK